MSASAFIGVGSNLAARENIRQALRLLRRLGVPVTGVSTFYRTAPLGGRADPPYLNGVLRVAADGRKDGPLRLRRILKEIETRLGRLRAQDRFASRPIDLDLILYADRVIREEGLEVPDPKIYQRPFLSLPLAELEPRLVLPDTGRSIREVARLQQASGAADMEPLEAFTREMRRLAQRGEPS